MANKKNKISLRKMIYNDKYLIIFSIILAVIVWTVASLNIGTDETKTVSVQVPISLSDELSKQIGMKYYSLQKNVNLNVTISGAKYVIGQVDEDDLSVKFDTSNVNRTGEQEIPIIVTNKSKTLDFNITSTYPSSIEAYYDVEETRIFDIYLTYNENAVADGYVFGTPVMSEDKVVVTGPKTFVDKIERASVDVDFDNKTDLTELYNGECKIDIQGNGVETSYLTLNSRTDPSAVINNISVTLPILKVVDLPVKVNFEDTPSGMSKVPFSVRYSVSSLHCGILDSADLDSAVIGSISFSDLKPGNNRFSFDVTDIQGIYLLDDSVSTVKVKVGVPSTYKAVTYDISSDDVELDVVGDGVKATLNKLSDDKITVIIPRSVDKDDITLSLKCEIDEDDEKSGSYPLSISVSDKNAWIYGEYTADVTIK